MEAQYFYGPPLLNAQVAAMRAGRELFITTFDRDRKVGVVYRMLGGRAELFAGGTPPAGGPPLLVQPEGAAVDAAGEPHLPRPPPKRDRRARSPGPGPRPPPRHRAPPPAPAGG